MQTLMRSAVAKLLDLIERYLNESRPDDPENASERSSFVSYYYASEVRSALSARVASRRGTTA